MFVLNSRSDCSKVCSILTKVCRAWAALNVITSSFMQLNGDSRTSPDTELLPPVSRSNSAIMWEAMAVPRLWPHTMMLTWSPSLLVSQARAVRASLTAVSSDGEMLVESP